jgi:hypothetical protein
METDELEYEQIAPEKILKVPKAGFRLINRVPGAPGLFTVEGLVFSVYATEDNRIGYKVTRPDGGDPTDEDMAVVQESMLFITCPPANALPA